MDTVLWWVAQHDGRRVKPASITGTFSHSLPLLLPATAGDKRMLKGGLLWLIGIPLPIILIIYFFTGWLR